MTDKYIGLAQQQFKKGNRYNGKNLIEKANVRIFKNLGEVIFNNIDVLSLVVEEGTTVKASGSIKVESFIVVFSGDLWANGNISTNSDIKIGGNLKSRGLIEADGYIDVSGNIYSSVMTKSGKSIFAHSIRSSGLIECHEDMWIEDKIESNGGLLVHGIISAKEVHGGNGHYIACKDLIKGTVISGELVTKSK